VIRQGLGVLIKFNETFEKGEIDATKNLVESPL
jgi:hypothetical protein